MPRILLDTNMPRGLQALLTGHDVQTARHMGWDRLTNGDLLAAAENAGFDVMSTADRNIPHQQNLANRRIALIELTTTHWETIRDNVADVSAAVAQAAEGGYGLVKMPRPPQLRRPFPPPPEY
jgi:hypothetical protein